MANQLAHHQDHPALNHEITQLLLAASNGDSQASENLFSRVEKELRALARREFRRWPTGNTLQPTALVSEVYLRMFGKSDSTPPETQRFFYAAAARIMHDVMIEHARRRTVRGKQEPASNGLPAPSESKLDLEELKVAICGLDRVDSRAAEVFRMRMLMGLAFEQIAETIEVSIPTIMRDLRFARAWLRERLHA